MSRSEKAIILLVTLSAGCSGPVADYSAVELINGAGTVTLDNQPLTNAVVTFEDPADDTFSYGLTDANGKYILQFDSEMKGVKVGRKLVRISTTRRIQGLNSKPGQADGNYANADRKIEIVPERYHKKSGLTVQVNHSSGPFNFSLTTK